MKKMKTKLIAILTAILTVFVMMPQMAAPAHAAQVAVNYVERTWDNSAIQEVEVSQPCTVVTSSEGNITWDSGWYAVTQDAAITGQITFNEDVNLVLCDGATLTVSGAIVGSDGKNISIYEGSTSDTIIGNGALVVTTGAGYTNDPIVVRGNGNVNITGGRITVKKASGSGAGIFCHEGSINILGGIVETEGYASGSGMMGFYSSSEINIYGGTVFAKSGENRGIGIKSGKISINGGTVISTGDESGLNCTGVNIVTGSGVLGFESNDGTTWSAFTGGDGTKQYAAIGVPVAEIGDAEYPSPAVAVSQSITGETIRLIDNVVTNAEIMIPKDKNITLDLNNHGIMYAGSKSNNVLEINRDGTLTLEDNSANKTSHYITLNDGRGTAVSLDESAGAIAVTGGFITGGNSLGLSILAGAVYTNGEFNMKGGTIIGNKAERGGGVYIGSNGTFNMTGGSIIYNTAVYSGGGVNTVGMINMTGGSIANNTAGEDGGGINIGVSGTLNMTGGSITYNTADGNGGNGGGIWVSGMAKVFNISGASVITGNTTGGADKNVYLASNKDTNKTNKITVTGILADGAAIGVTLGTPDGKGVFAVPGTPEGSQTEYTITTTENGDMAKFTSDNPDLEVGETTEDNKTVLELKEKEKPTPGPEPDPTPGPEPTPAPTPAEVSSTPLTTMTASGKTAMTIAWEKTEGVDGYDVFFSRCDNNDRKVSTKNVATIEGNDIFTWTASGLKAGKTYKAYVKAYVMKDGAKQYVKSSPLMHAYAAGASKKYCNAKCVKVKKTSVSLKAGKTYKLKAKVRKLKKGKKLMPKSHVAKVRYLSTDTSIATVSKKGKVKGVKAGTCYVYAYAHNGVFKKVTVTVK